MKYSLGRFPHRPPGCKLLHATESEQSCCTDYCIATKCGQFGCIVLCDTFAKFCNGLLATVCFFEFWVCNRIALESAKTFFGTVARNGIALKRLHCNGIVLKRLHCNGIALTRLHCNGIAFNRFALVFGSHPCDTFVMIFVKGTERLAPCEV